MKIKSSKAKSIILDNAYILGFVKEAVPNFILLTVLISMLAFVDTFSNTWLSKVVFDGMSQKTPYISILVSVLILLGMMLLSAILRTVFFQRKTPVANEKIKYHIRAILFRKTKSLDLYCFEDANFYDKYTRALSEADERAFGVLSSLSSFTSSFVSLVTLSFIIIYLDPLLILFALIGTLISSLIANKLAKLKYDYDVGKTSMDRKTGYTNRIFYEPQYAKDIKMDNMYFYFINSYRKTVSDLHVYINAKTSRIAFYELLSSAQSAIMQTAMIIFLTYRVFSNEISIGDYAALLNSTFALMFQLGNFFGLIPQFYKHSLYISNLKEIMTKAPVIENESGIELAHDKSITIGFRNVSFAYPNSDNLVLKNISIDFFPGKKHAIVGHNGAGKSTIIKLILRLYDVTEGEILVNGINIKKYNVSSLRKRIATVFQDFQLYSIPLADYILSKECDCESDEERVMSSLQCVGLDDKIEKLKKKEYAVLSKEFDAEGIIMSGGENQKLALAKAFAKDGALMILDEPSSALDPISEYELHRMMLAVAQEKTVILISHRLSTTKDASVIYYIESGRLIEAGNHDALMKKNGKYAQMFTVQAESYQLNINF